MKSLFNEGDSVKDYFNDLFAHTLDLSAISTTNLMLNQDEDQLQRTKIDFGRNENQRGIICLYPENRPRVTICPLGYTAVGYRNGIKISGCKN